MKRLIIFLLALSVTSLSNPLSSQNETHGYLGDNFSLEGALEAFKNATSIDDFENKINDESSNVNNLDLNDDDEIDYIRVEEYIEGDVHAIVLQALISEQESQDIAVIEIERDGEESATIQIAGDEYLYGEDYLVEPFDEVGVSNGSGGPSADYHMSRVVVNVWFWPSVRHIYRPNYVVYRSPFRWKVYPKVWRPWRPLTWNVYRGKRIKYNHTYRAVNTRRIIQARNIYTPKRRTSKVVVKKSHTVTKVRTTKNGKRTVTRSTKTVKTNKNSKAAAKSTKAKSNAKKKTKTVVKKKTKSKKRSNN